MYKEIFNEITNELSGIADEKRNLWIPIDATNSDYQRYLRWLNDPKAAEYLIEIVRSDEPASKS